MWKVKEVYVILNICIILSKEGFHAAKISYLGGLWVLGELAVREKSEENSLSCKHICLKTKMDVIINECFKIIINGNVYWIRVKELDAWVPKFLSDNDNFSYNGFYESDEGSKFDEKEIGSNKEERYTSIKGISNPIYPPGFTPACDNNDKEGEANSVNDHNSKTKMENIDLFSIKMLWGNLTFDHALEGFDNFVKDTWNSLHVTDSNALIRMKKKLQLPKYAIKHWVMKYKKTRNEAKFTIKSKLHEVDKVLDRGRGDDEEELWCTITFDEIKNAVWECGINKSPGLDGFTFEFFKKYWNIIGQDIVAAVSQFFASGEWDISNINMIVNILKCFFMASGLKISLHKSKLSGIGISKEDTDLAASIVGCSTCSFLFHYLGDKGIKVANKLGHTSLACSFRRIPRSGAEEEQYKNLKFITSDVILPHMQDRWFWSLKGSGDFTVKSVRNYIDETLLPKLDAPTHWVNLVPIKINILAWKISMDRLPTRFNLSSRGLEIPSILCPLCN
uniref:RNA-directed DNA polymerase, eukaryota n=1 Tax=Tanacetum cinerariifolium TaxID=118510 RepID=A0A6L2NE43_TANCI|nr:RNA-directed DNA polymerase, eukaryota [Tanacetum cinerariifolium]